MSDGGCLACLPRQLTHYSDEGLSLLSPSSVSTTTQAPCLFMWLGTEGAWTSALAACPRPARSLLRPRAASFSLHLNQSTLHLHLCGRLAYSCGSALDRVLDSNRPIQAICPTPTPSPSSRTTRRRFLYLTMVHFLDLKFSQSDPRTTRHREALTSTHLPLPAPPVPLNTHHLPRAHPHPPHLTPRRSPGRGRPSPAPASLRRPARRGSSSVPLLLS